MQRGDDSAADGRVSRRPRSVTRGSDGAPLRDGGLNRKICAQKSVDDILRLFASRRNDFMDINMVTALHRVAKMGGKGVASGVGPAPDMEAFRSLLGEVRTRIPGLEPHHLTNIAWALARLSLPDKAFLAEVENVAVARISDSGPSDLAFTTWAFASLDYRAERFLQAAWARGMPMLTEFTSAEVATTAWSVARLQMYDVPLFRALSGTAVARLGNFNSQELSNTIGAFAKVTLMDEPLLKAVSAQVGLRISEIDPGDMVGIVWAFAKLLATDSSMFAAVSEAALSVLSSFQS